MYFNVGKYTNEMKKSKIRTENALDNITNLIVLRNSLGVSKFEANNQKAAATVILRLS